MVDRSRRLCPRACKPLLAFAYAGADKRRVRARERLHGDVAEWRRNPGGGRGSARRVTRQLIALVRWADSVFRQGTVESVNESLQWYLLAAALMGPSPARPGAAMTSGSPRARVMDRLGKLRNGQTIDGARRKLPLWDPPVDPALLERAAAEGIDVETWPTDHA